MAKPRKTNNYLPSRVYQKHNAYYYVDSNNKWHRLGKTLSEAMQSWINTFAEHSNKCRYMHDLFDRYLTEIPPTKSPKSYKENIRQMKNIKAAFGHIPPNEVTPVHIYKYLNFRGKRSPVSANREISLLSRIFSMAIRWGEVLVNPCKHVKRLPEPKRDRSITDKKSILVKNTAPPVMCCVMDFPT